MQPTVEQSASALKEAKEKLDDLGIPFCLFLGSALGAYRDGTFCPGDTDDIDIAVDAAYFDKLSEIKAKFKDWRLYHVLKAEDGLCPEISLEKLWGDCYTKIDFFFINELSGRCAWRFYMKEDGTEYLTKYFDRKHFIKWDKIKFFGEEYNIPGDIENYLIDNYGDWKTPIHRDNWDWATDNKCDED